MVYFAFCFLLFLLCICSYTYITLHVRCTLFLTQGLLNILQVPLVVWCMWWWWEIICYDDNEYLISEWLSYRTKFSWYRRAKCFILFINCYTILERAKFKMQLKMQPKAEKLKESWICWVVFFIKMCPAICTVQWHSLCERVKLNWNSSLPVVIRYYVLPTGHIGNKNQIKKIHISQIDNDLDRAKDSL